MMHKACCCLEEVPFCFSRSSANSKVTRLKKIADFDPSWAFQDCNSSLNSPMALKWCTKLEAAEKRAVPCCFSKSSVKFQGHTVQKNRRFWPELSVSGPTLQFDFTDGYDMMHKAGYSIEEVPYFFFGVIHQIPWSHGLKNWWFGPYLSKITRPIADIKSLRFALFPSC